MTELAAYLQRIGYRGVPRPDLETLVQLHRRHLLAIPYENLDVQLGRPVGLDIGPIRDKLVRERRGGWCYEMNGLFAWALEEIGFPLSRLAAGVGRAVRGDAAVGNHLALRIDLGEPYLADVGFGDGLFDPVPIRAGPLEQRGFAFSLEALPGGWWRVHNHPYGAAPSFDFTTTPGDRSLLERQCAFLQTAPESPFRQVAVAQRHLPQGLVALRGKLLRRIGRHGVDERTVEDRRDYARVLREVFDLDPPEVDTLWERVERAHAAYVNRMAGEAT